MSTVVRQIKLLDDASVFAVFPALDVDVDFDAEIRTRCV
jgi:hypothetical protein